MSFRNASIPAIPALYALSTRIAVLFASALCLLAALAAGADAGDPLERLDAVARSGSDGGSLQVILADPGRSPRSDFQQGEDVAVALMGARPGRAFGVLVDSHGVATLAGDEGWLGEVGDSGELFARALGEAHWQTGLPLGEANLYVFVLRGGAAATLEPLAAKSESGVVREDSLAALVEALAGAQDAPRGHASLRFVHREVPKTRSGLPGTPEVIDSEAIIAFFTGPRTRAVTRPKLDVYIPFDFNDAGLNTMAQSHVEQIGEALADRRLANLKFVLAGHSDRRGAPDYNRELSKRRAASVRDALATEFGIDTERISIVGYGAEHPLDASDTDDGHAANRRVELQLKRE